MSDGGELRVYSRREALELSAAGVAGALLPSCGGSSRGRSFRVARAFRWEPEDVFQEVAFSFVSDRIVDYVDGLCDGCGRGTRFFLFAVDVAVTAATIACPECSVGTRITIALTRELVSELAVYGFGRALGVLEGNSYVIHKVGPLAVRNGVFAVARSAVCYDIREREPTRLFDRQIAAFPEKICYFTEVSAAPGQDVIHVWRCNGQVTDRIPLDADSSSWRTWSAKENLARGTWIVSTELPSGEVLDTREFHIQ